MAQTRVCVDLHDKLVDVFAEDQLAEAARHVVGHRLDEKLCFLTELFRRGAAESLDQDARDEAHEEGAREEELRAEEPWLALSLLLEVEEVVEAQQVQLAEASLTKSFLTAHLSSCASQQVLNKLLPKSKNSNQN